MKLIKFVLGLLVVFAGIVIIGSIGAYDAGNISLLRMFVQILLSILAIIIFAKLEEKI